jgi:D-alanyl-D-alanine carboxypeptidase (penicillin-binding protein 5/6)
MKRTSFKLLLITTLVGLIIGAVYLYSRPLPQVQAQAVIPAAPKTQAINLPWPAVGQGAVGATGYGVLASHNTATPVSIASIAKVIAAMAVLEQKPLGTGETGPTITFDNQDLDFYNYYYSNDGSVAKVAVGEQITEYQALQAMLLPSANNMADSLTRWAFGSSTAYTTYANQMVKKIGLTKTTVGGASGFADDTTSTADDLVKLGILAVGNPVIAQIVNQSTADIPVAGQVKNVNWLLGTEGVNGIKTGNTDKAGGCFLFAAKRQINGKEITMVGAFLGDTNRNQAIAATVPILKAADNGFETVTPIHNGQVLASYKTPWNTSAKAIAAKDVSLTVWKGQNIKILNDLDAIPTPALVGAPVGEATVLSSGLSSKTTIQLDKTLAGPPWTWRLLH